jgi:hypothetical protein
MRTDSIASVATHCKTVTCGVLPDGVPGKALGPRLHAVLSVLTGAYRLSERQGAELWSERCRAGAVAQDLLGERPKPIVILQTVAWLSPMVRSSLKRGAD